MFDALSERLERLGASLRSKGRLSDADLDAALADVRSALLEADVELGVVRAFLDAVRARLSGTALIQSLSPGQQVINALIGLASLVLIVLFGWLWWRDREQPCPEDHALPQRHEGHQENRETGDPQMPQSVRS